MVVHLQKHVSQVEAKYLPRKNQQKPFV